MQKCSHCPSWCVWHFIHNPFSVIAMGVIWLSCVTGWHHWSPGMHSAHCKHIYFFFLKIPLRSNWGPQVSLSYLCIMHELWMNVPSVEMFFIYIYLLRCSWNTVVITVVKCSESVCLQFYSSFLYISDLGSRLQ